MNETVELMLRILGLLLAAAGLVVVYLAPRIVEKKDLAAKKKVDQKIAENLTEEELIKYRKDGATLDVKLKGLLLAAPGFILILVAF